MQILRGKCTTRILERMPLIKNVNGMITDAVCWAKGHGGAQQQRRVEGQEYRGQQRQDVAARQDGAQAHHPIARLIPSGCEVPGCRAAAHHITCICRRAGRTPALTQTLRQAQTANDVLKCEDAGQGTPKKRPGGCVPAG
ncbi:hypothetical protein C8J57DRAFT_1232242 [Mycena rebaudengoi]|nr:hypothetical protein C8J57DRAFT_1232242 [Mycena rebaudengoi]